MGTKLLVLNLPPTVDVSMLEDMFTTVGDVRAVKIDCDTITGLSSGVGHVEMSSIQQAQDSIEHFNGQSTRGHVLVVKEDKPHVPQVKRAIGVTKRVLLKAASKRKRS